PTLGEGGTDGDLFDRLVASMVGYWNMRGMQTEARNWLNRALNRPINRSRPRAVILMKAGLLALDAGDHDSAISMFSLARDVYTELADQAGSGSAIIALGRV